MSDAGLPESGRADSQPRSIRQPGLPSPERCIAIPVSSTPIKEMLPAGSLLRDALHALLAGRFDAACLTLSGGSLQPFEYVIPARSPDADHAAFYSETFRPPGETRFEIGTVTVGFRDGKPFFHCHGLWAEADGRRGCGHILPDETVIASPILAQGAGIVGARFEVHPDRETGYSLLSPVATKTPHPAGASPAIALRLAPNQDIITALEAAGSRAGFTQAVIMGGVGSTIEARFTAAPPINGFATEFLVRHSMIRCDGVGAPTELDIVIVDLDGHIGEGRLVAHDNPVLITFEGVMQAS